jgi:membrane protein
VVEEFRRGDLALRASGIAFRVLVATIPTTLFVIALLGFFGLEEVWTEQVAPGLRENVSEAVFTVIDSAVTRVLGNQNGYWLTVGALVALGSLASVAQALSRTLNRLYEVEDSRPLVDRVTNALGIGVAAAAIVLAALALVRLGPLAFDAVLGDSFAVEVLSFLVRWGGAAALLVGLLLLTRRVAPDLEEPLPLLAAGSAIIVAGWLMMSILFGLYLRYVASYDSVFGNLATVYVAVQYIALSATLYVVGLVVNKVLADRGLDR